MEIWQVASLLGWWRKESDIEPAAPGGAEVRGRPISDSALIKARLAAHARGEGEPLWIFGEPGEPVGAGNGR